jgi:hypothetical protein
MAAGVESPRLRWKPRAISTAYRARKISHTLLSGAGDYSEM